MGKREFNNTWLKRTDSNDHCVGLWCVKKDDNTATCTLCQKDINIAYMGFGALNQHVDGRGTKDLEVACQNQKQRKKLLFI